MKIKKKINYWCNYWYKYNKQLIDWSSLINTESSTRYPTTLTPNLEFGPNHELNLINFIKQTNCIILLNNNFYNLISVVSSKRPEINIYFFKKFYFFIFVFKIFYILFFTFAFVISFGKEFNSIMIITMQLK